MKQTAKIGCRVLVALLCLAMLASVITLPTFAAENSALSSLAGQDLSAFIDLINKYNEVKDDPDAAAQLKEFVDKEYAENESFKESANEILGATNEKEAKDKFGTVIDDVLVNDEYIGDIDTVVDAIQNGASFDEIKESIEQQKNPDPDKKPSYVTWEIDGVNVSGDPVEVPYMKLIPAFNADIPAGKYVKWDNEILFAPDGENVVIKGTTVDIVEKVVSDVNGLPMNYGEYEIVYENGVATLYVNVDASNYKQILRDVIGDVREGGAASAYKQAVTSFFKASATEIYNGKVNTVSVNGYEVFAIEGYGISQLVDLLNTVEAGNYGEIVSAAGLKNALLVDPISPSDLANVGDDGVLAAYDVVLGAEGKTDSEIELRVALRGDLDLVRKGADAILTAADYVIDSNGDLDVEITVPAAFAKSLTKALNSARVSEETKQTIVKGLSECATVGELFDLFDLLKYDQFIEVVEYLLDNVDAASDKEQALLDKIEAMRPAFELAKEYGNILIDKAPESLADKEASLTIKSVYNLTQMVSYDELVELSQLKDADALIGSARLNDVTARVANKLNVSADRAQDIVTKMVEVFADYQNRIPDSAKAKTAYEYTYELIDLLYNKVPEKYADAKLTDTYKGNGEFSFAFSKTYNPGAWLQNVLADVSITAYGRTLVLADYIPSREITSDVSVTVNVSDLYSVTYMDGDQVVFEGFLPYGAEIAPYGKDAAKDGYSLEWTDENGDVVTTMPGADTVLYAKHKADKHTITFVVMDEAYEVEADYGTVPAWKDEWTNLPDLNFVGWEGYGLELPVVTGDATYVAEYTATITFEILDVAYDVEVKYNEIPTWDEALTDLSTLNFKGWKDYGFELPKATAHATYVAEFTANVTFHTEGKESFTLEVAYNTVPVVDDATKTVDIEYRYEFDGWYTADGVKMDKVTAHTEFYAQFNAISHLDEHENLTREGNVFTLTFGDYVANGNRMTASAVIPAFLFDLAEVNSDVVLTAVIGGDEAVEGAHAISVTLDNKALLNIKDNATADEITFAVSSLIDAEEGCPTFDAYYAVYSFDLIGSAFDGANEGKATVVVPFEENAAKFHGYVYYLNGDVTDPKDVSESESALTFTTSHFSYYAVDYKQYLYTIEFYDINEKLIDTVEINTDEGDTFTEADLPPFTTMAPDAAGHYVSCWTYSNPVDPVKQFEQSPRDYKFYEAVDCVAHTYGDYELVDATNHKRTCSECGYEDIAAHEYVDGECVCGDVLPPEESSSDETTTPEETTPEETTPEETTPEVTTPAESESETQPTEQPKNKNGWWIFLIVLLVIIAILIVAYILYGHNIFPKGPAPEEETAPEQEEVTDEQIIADHASDAPVEEIHIVDHVAASEVDQLMTDSQAVHAVELVAAVSASGKMGAVNVGTLNENFETGDKVDIEVLKEKKLIDADCKRVKILADGDLDKVLIVEANSFSLQAIKMITLTGGHALKLQTTAPVEEAPAAEAPAEETPVEETPVEETPVEEAPVEEAPVEEAPVEEAPAEEAPVEEAPAEEAPAEETPAEETDAE